MRNPYDRCLQGLQPVFLAKIVATKIAAEYRADKSRWTQNWFAKDTFGNRTDSLSGNSVCWCLRGAIEKFTPRDTHSVKQVIFKAFDEALGYVFDYQHLNLVSWNDMPLRTVDEVIDLCDKVAQS